MSGSQVSQTQPSDGFAHFKLLPPELQLLIFEEALAGLSKPRIVILDIETVPAYNRTRSRDLTLGWKLKVDNHDELHKESALELARSVLQTCIGTGKYVARRFIKAGRVSGRAWDRPLHSEELLSHNDLSLVSDVFWLPDDLFAFDWTKGMYPAGRRDWKDEERIACLMMSLDSLEEVTRWATGRFEGRGLEYEANGHVSLDELSLTLHNVLACYPSCEEIIVVVGTPSGDRKHISWTDLDHIEPNDRDMASKLDLYAADQDEADRCQDVFQTYYALRETATGSNGDVTPAPELSFAFKKHRKTRRRTSSVPEIVIPVGSGSGSRKRSRDEYDDATVSEMPPNKRRRIV